VPGAAPRDAAMDGSYTGHDWRWICSVLASRTFAPPRLPLVDTVLIERGRPSLWLGLDADGRVVGRPVTAVSTRDIYNTFTALSLGYVRNTAQRACVAHYSVGLPQVSRERPGRGLRRAPTPTPTPPPPPIVPPCASRPQSPPPPPAPPHPTPPRPAPTPAPFPR
jgi:hypothetical protein